jgi:hypothetical protein
VCFVVSKRNVAGVAGSRESYGRGVVCLSSPEGRSLFGSVGLCIAGISLI